MTDFMKSDFSVTDIDFALYVGKNKSNHTHENRKNYGLAINVNADTKTYVFKNGKTVTLGQNEIIFLPKGSSYKIYSDSSGECYAINYDLLYDVALEPFCFKPKNALNFIKLFEKICLIWKNKRDSYNMQCKALLYEILVMMQREYNSAYISKRRLAAISPALEYIHKNYTSADLKISELADMCGISVAYFRKMFVKYYNISPLKYINDLKIKYAQDLLRAGELSISKIAKAAGFTDPAYFSREFKKSVGIAPSEYK